MKRAVLLCLFLAGCAYVEPLVQDFNIVSVPQEIQLGRQVEAEIQRHLRFVNDPSTLARLGRIASPLVSALPRRDFEYRFYVIEDPTPNAFTVPGGAIYVHTGLLGFVRDEGELAGVLAHELGHALERHPAKAISRDYGVQSLATLLFKGERQAFYNMAFSLARGGLLSRYGREDERRADEAAFFLLRRAGFPTGGLLRFLRHLQSLQQGGTLAPFLSSHPPTAERAARLEELEKGVSGRYRLSLA
jgi:predicted Zn-dependent protease